MLSKEYIKDYKVSDLIPYAKNPRINDKAVDGVIKSIKRNGNIDPIEIDEDNIILTGHSRLKAFNKMKIETADVIRVTGLTEKQKNSYRVEHNKTNELADWDMDLLQEDFTMEELEDMNFDIDIGEEETEVVEDEAPELKEKSPVKLGDIWTLGKHRLMCGDSTDAGSVALLMDGEKADMVFTDPPYNVAYEGGSKKRDAIANDKINDFYKFLYNVYVNCFVIMKDGSPIYVAHSELERINFTKAFLDAGFKLSSIIIWVKNNSTFSMNKDYKWKHEPILYGWKQGEKRTWEAGNLEDTIWEIDRPSRSEEHPTMKPIELCAKAIKNSSKSNDIVLDLFLGSGSTLIACEQLDRKCYGMELDPKYCDVGIRRWQKLTGQEAIREDGKKYSEVIDV